MRDSKIDSKLKFIGKSCDDPLNKTLICGRFTKFRISPLDSARYLHNTAVVVEKHRYVS